MTEAEKKELYDREYAKSLKYEKSRFRSYETHLKIPLKERWEIFEHVKAVFEIMKKCGVKRFDSDEAPMCNVSDILIKLKTKGDPESLKDFLISNHESCWTTVLFEPTEEELESSARRSAEIEVDFAEMREKQAAEDAERLRKEAEAEEAQRKAEEEQKAKIEELKKESYDALAELAAKRNAVRAWSDSCRDSLDDIRKGRRRWYAEDCTSASELAAVEKYVETLRTFTEEQNAGFTGMMLYAANEARANAHEDMLEAFGLEGSEYARDITKSYDFADDYDFKTQTYVHLPDGMAEKLLSFALLEARKREALQEVNDKELKTA